MPTQKKRINISLSPAIEQALDLIAKRDQVPPATKAAHLLELALELEEDRILSEIAEKRAAKGARLFSHKRFWA